MQRGLVLSGRHQVSRGCGEEIQRHARQGLYTDQKQRGTRPLGRDHQNNDLQRGIHQFSAMPNQPGDLVQRNLVFNDFW